MNKLLHRFFAILLTFLLVFSTAFAEGSAIEQLGAALSEAQQACDSLSDAYEALTEKVAKLENQYNTASKKQKASLEEQWLEAMEEQEEMHDALLKAQDSLSSYQAEHQALLHREEDHLEALCLEYEGKYAGLTVNVQVDENLVIYALSAQVDGSERDKLVGEMAYLYQFLGKDLPLTIGNGKKDDVQPLSQAQQTSKDLVAALNSLVYVEEDTASGGYRAPDGPITAPQDIADYIFAYGHLPENFLTKKEAQARGWDSRENYVGEVCPGMSIGGDRFGNYEGVLPTQKGRTWTEADANYKGRSRGAERVVFSNDGLVYYTNDHYETFTQLFPSWE